MIDAIDFGSGGIGTPMISTEKQWLMHDESLPVALPNKQPLDKKVYLSLRPYTANTPYDYDPVRQKKIKVNKDTWRNDPFRHFKTQFIYSNWAKSPLDKGVRNSLAEIEASGQRQNPFTQSWHSTSAPTGNDFMPPFTKDFWNRSAVKRRRRTMEVLSQYGDSTTANINVPIMMPVIR